MNKNPLELDDLEIDSRLHFRSLRVVMFLSLAATTTVALALAILHGILQHSSGPLDAVVFAVPLLAILIAHGTFALGWLLLGDDHWSVRGAFTVSAFACSLIALAPIETMHRPRWMTLTILTSAMGLIPLMILRFMGRRCVRPTAVFETEHAAQFTIRDLFFVTTLVACALGLGRLIDFTFVGNVKEGLMIFSAIALIGAFAWTFGLSYSWPISLGLMAMASPAIGYGISFLENQPMIWSIFGATTGIATFGYLCILRMHGYRIGRVRKTLAPNAQSNG